MLIKPEELRIGNLIRHNPNGGDGEIIRLHTIGKSTVHGESLDWQLKNLKIDLDRWNEPISLTPEILITCGFRKGKKDESNFIIDLDNNNTLGCGWGSFEEFDINGMELPVSPKYLHQLQNLYFALTGKELEYEK